MPLRPGYAPKDSVRHGPVGGCRRKQPRPREPSTRRLEPEERWETTGDPSRLGVGRRVEAEEEGPTGLDTRKDLDGGNGPP